MSSSLAGGLVPLGSRSRTGTGGSKGTTLSGGLVALNTKSPPATTPGAAAGDRPRDGGGSSGGWDQQEDDPGLRQEGSSSGLYPEKKVSGALPRVEGVPLLFRAGTVHISTGRSFSVLLSAAGQAGICA